MSYLYLSLFSPIIILSFLLKSEIFLKNGTEIIFLLI